MANEREATEAAAEALRQELDKSHPEWVGRRALIAEELATTRQVGQRAMASTFHKHVKPSNQELLITVLFGTKPSDVQRLNTLKYRENMQSRFEGENDNAITKITMASFGLPCEPLTLANLLNAGLDTMNDPPGNNDEAHDRYAEATLKWLDVYWEKGYGYPMLRVRRETQSDSNNQPTQGVTIDELEKYLGTLPEKEKEKLRNRRGNMNRHRLDRTTFDTGTELQHLKGGTLLIPVYCRFGMKPIRNDFEDFMEFIRLAFPTPVWDQALSNRLISIDIFVKTGPSQDDWEHSDTLVPQNLNRRYFEQEIQPHFSDPESELVRVRLRGRETDPIRPTKRYVLVKMYPGEQRERYAYWVLPPPIQRDPDTEAFELGFRLALEFLIPNHVERDIQWEIRAIRNSVGRLSLRESVPSGQLWNAMVDAAVLAFDDNGQQATVEIKLLQRSEKPGLIFMRPGLDAEECLDPRGWMPDINEYGRRGVQPHRKLGQIDQLQIWKNPLHYACDLQADPTIILDRDDNENKENFTTNNGIHACASLIVRPILRQIILVTDTEGKEEEINRREQIVWTATPNFQDFRNFVARLYADRGDIDDFNTITIRVEDTGCIFDLPVEEEHVDADEFRYDVFYWFSGKLFITLDSENFMGDSMELPRVPEHRVVEVEGQLEEEFDQQIPPGTAGSSTDSFKSFPPDTPVETKWQKYMREQTQGDQARMDAWTKAQSVHQHSAPAIPTYGQTKESRLQSGFGLPVIFNNNFTPQRFEQLRGEIRRLRNQLLERASHCPICDGKLAEPGYHTDAAIDHLATHFKDSEEAMKYLGTVICPVQGCSIRLGQGADLSTVATILRHIFRHPDETQTASRPTVGFKNIGGSAAVEGSEALNLSGITRNAVPEKDDQEKDFFERNPLPNPTGLTQQIGQSISSNSYIPPLRHQPHPPNQKETGKLLQRIPQVWKDCLTPDALPAGQENGPLFFFCLYCLQKVHDEPLEKHRQGTCKNYTDEQWIVHSQATIDDFSASVAQGRPVPLERFALHAFYTHQSGLLAPIPDSYVEEEETVKGTDAFNNEKDVDEEMINDEEDSNEPVGNKRKRKADTDIDPTYEDADEESEVDDLEKDVVIEEEMVPQEEEEEDEGKKRGKKRQKKNNGKKKAVTITVPAGADEKKKGEKEKKKKAPPRKKKEPAKAKAKEDVQQPLRRSTRLRK